ncbi:hypothetical protein K501DRAFT_271264 [Backusella circina FSU 941]|nr:hypothetical protein K501DRAFT_271264 [Backusella circina FSU 941]
MYTERNHVTFPWRKQHCLGKPPGASRRLSIDTSMHQTDSHSVTKIAPLREIEQVIQDLKKENFDLKLRLYHLEDSISARISLHQQSLELRSDLQVQSQRLTLLEQELLKDESVISPADSFYKTSSFQQRVLLTILSCSKDTIHFEPVLDPIGTSKQIYFKLYRNGPLSLYERVNFIFQKIKEKGENDFVFGFKWK